jgi:cell division septum initiation protein DivIVA
MMEQQDNYDILLAHEKELQAKATALEKEIAAGRIDVFKIYSEIAAVAAVREDRSALESAVGEMRKYLPIIPRDYNPEATRLLQLALGYLNSDASSSREPTNGDNSKPPAG